MKHNSVFYHYVPLLLCAFVPARVVTGLIDSHSAYCILFHLYLDKLTLTLYGDYNFLI
jgi:hypothetical protein